MPGRLGTSCRLSIKTPVGASKITGVAFSLEFVGEDLAVQRSARCWISAKHFRFPSGPDHVALLVALIDDRQYADHYAGETPEAQGEHPAHGPYRRSGIVPASFEPVSGESAVSTVSDWAVSWAEPATDSSASPLSIPMQEAIEPLQRPGVQIYQLTGIDDDARHEWGWVVGTHGFHEFVVIDHTQSSIDLLVASDD